ncbi:MAG: flagellar biosynthetic protein FliO [Bacillota bacterium]|nr:flagellar biosynthetic protein FliO [Bacillota bacterium]
MGDLALTILKLLICIPFVILLIYLSLKVGGNKLQNIQNGKYIKILERIQVSKENYLLVVRLGEKAYVMSSTNNKIETISELTEEEFQKITSSIKMPEFKNFNVFFNNIRNKKEEKNDKET